MHTVGLIGGMSWYSTTEYYRVINETVQQRLGGHASAPMAIQSLDFAQIRRCQVEGDWDRAGALLAQAAQRCEAAGAQSVMICTNLMHRVADQVQNAVDIPLLHIGDAIAAQALARGWHTLGLLATSWVMEEPFYIERLRAHGLQVIVPELQDRREIDRVIFDELTQGVVTSASRERYQQVIASMADGGAQAVILGCTEIELLLKSQDTALPLLDSMRSHAEAAAMFVLDGTQVRPPTHHLDPALPGVTP